AAPANHTAPHALRHAKVPVASSPVPPDTAGPAAVNATAEPRLARHARDDDHHPVQPATGSTHPAANARAAHRVHHAQTAPSAHQESRPHLYIKIRMHNLCIASTPIKSSHSCK